MIYLYASNLSKILAKHSLSHYLSPFISLYVSPIELILLPLSFQDFESLEAFLYC